MKGNHGKPGWSRLTTTMTVIQGTMTKNSYFGERALLFDEPRTATVEVSSPEAELWSIEQGFLDDGDGWG